MKLRSSAIAGFALLFGAAVFVAASVEDAEAVDTPTPAVQTAPVCEPVADLPFDNAPEEVKKKGDCSFKSDCGGAKCCKNRCAWALGSCCSFDSDCGFKGAKCRSGKCSNAPDGKCSFNSECPSGSCSSGKCK